MNVPNQVLGVPVSRVIDTWWVDDNWGSRAYCCVLTEDKREVTMLRTDEGWKPVLVAGVST